MAVEKFELDSRQKELLWNPEAFNYVEGNEKSVFIKYKSEIRGPDKKPRHCFLGFLYENPLKESLNSLIFVASSYQINYTTHQLDPEPVKKIIKNVNIEKEHPREQLEKEYELRELLPHLAIQAMIFVADQGFLIMDLQPGKDLVDHDSNIEMKNDDEKIRLSYAILRALKKQVVSKGLVHRDIKLDNVMLQLEPLMVNFIDFGFAMYADKFDQKHPGTRQYTAPEIFDGKPHDKPCDIFSVARLLAMYWSKHLGSYYFESTGNIDADLGISKSNVAKAQKDLMEYRREGEKAEKVCKILYPMLSPDPARRPDIDRVLQMFEMLFADLLHDMVPPTPEAASTSSHSEAVYDLDCYLKTDASPANHPAAFFSAGYAGYGTVSFENGCSSQKVCCALQ